MRALILLPLLCLLCLGTACGGGGGASSACHGTLNFSAGALPLGQTHFTMCTDSFPATEGSFATDTDADPSSNTAITVLVQGLSPESTLTCSGSGAVAVAVQDPNYTDFNGNDDQLVTTSGGGCTINTTTYSEHKWVGNATGTIVTYRCTGPSSCGRESFPFSADWVLGSD